MYGSNKYAVKAGELEIELRGMENSLDLKTNIDGSNKLNIAINAAREIPEYFSTLLFLQKVKEQELAHEIKLLNKMDNTFRNEGLRLEEYVYQEREDKKLATAHIRVLIRKLEKLKDTIRGIRDFLSKEVVEKAEQEARVKYVL
jgi:hypothetical protein